MIEVLTQQIMEQEQELAQQINDGYMDHGVVQKNNIRDSDVNNKKTDLQ